MKQSILVQKTGETNKSSCVAWFKLAELVTRKEKEKALSLYRLLAHSFENKAYALQLEGDILWSLEDNQALQKYSQAAFLYKKELRITSAIAIYYHLLTLQPDNFEFLSTLLSLYALSCWQEKFEECVSMLLQWQDDGKITQDQAFACLKKVINFTCAEKLIAQDEDDANYLRSGGADKFKWILKSLYLMLKKSNTTLNGKIKEYCLEHDLNFKA